MRTRAAYAITEKDREGSENELVNRHLAPPYLHTGSIPFSRRNSSAISCILRSQNA